MNKITVLDGGMSRELERQGAPLRQPLWSAGALMDAQDSVLRAHLAFIEAGADIITTNNYAVIPFHIGDEAFRSEGFRLCQRAGEIARKAADSQDGIKVAGALPPACGSYVPERFDPDIATQILNVHVAAMAPYVDLWMAETMSSIQEARTTLKAVAGSDKPVWASFTLQDDADAHQSPHTKLRSGERLEDALALLGQHPIDALLFNCAQPEIMERAVRTAKAASHLPVGVFANAFAPKASHKGANEAISAIRDDLSPKAYLSWANQWIAAGATIIGGCCGVNAPHIAALSAHIKR